MFIERLHKENIPDIATVLSFMNAAIYECCLYENNLNVDNTTLLSSLHISINYTSIEFEGNIITLLYDVQGAIA